MTHRVAKATDTTEDYVMPTDIFPLYLKAYAKALSGRVFETTDFFGFRGRPCCASDVAAIALGVESAKTGKRMRRDELLEAVAEMVAGEPTSATP